MLMKRDKPSCLDNSASTSHKLLNKNPSLSLKYFLIRCWSAR